MSILPAGHGDRARRLHPYGKRPTYGKRPFVVVIIRGKSAILAPAGPSARTGS